MRYGRRGSRKECSVQRSTFSLRKPTTLPGEVVDKEVLDAAIIGAAQAVEHCEINRDVDRRRGAGAPLLLAHPNRGRMARQLETFAGVRDGRAIDLEDGYVLVEIVADQQIVSVGRERRPFRHAADLDIADMGT